MLIHFPIEVLSLQGEELHFRLPNGTMGHQLYSLVRERMPCKAGAKAGAWVPWDLRWDS